MKLSLLVPTCLISTLVGLTLPKLFDSPPTLILASIAYLLLLLGVDMFFGRSRPPEAP